jgi:hypothetical protein
MKRIGITILGVVIALMNVGWHSSERAGKQVSANPDSPKYTADNQLVRPENYREWVWLSSGLGMTYGPIAESAQNGEPAFDNVFASPAAYRSFLQTGKWPDKTVLVLEVRSSSSQGSINKGGHFQAGFLGIQAEVKDESRTPGKWAFYRFQGSSGSGTLFPSTASCYSCHSLNGAVDNTFVQFYPTLLEVARKKGTLQASAETKQ